MFIWGEPLFVTRARFPPAPLRERHKVNPSIFFRPIYKRKCNNKKWLYNLFIHEKAALWYNTIRRGQARKGGCGGVISFERVSKRYGAHEALRDVSFSVPRGQVLGLLGQNGAGKTTLMNILTGCLSASRGAVRVGGFDILAQPREAKRLMGYLPEHAPLYDEMTVRGYLRFACELKEVEKRAIPGHVEAVAEKTGLSDTLGRKIGNLSKGYRQRVGVAQALCGSPEIIILDEPTAGLDPKQSSDMRALIQALSGEHTLVFSSHILGEVQAVCGRVIILHHGAMICDQALDTLRRGEKRLRVRIAGGEATVLPALKQLKSVLGARVERGGEPGVTGAVLSVRGESGEAERELFAALSALQAPLLYLAPVEDSLEDVFLRATTEA